MVAAQVSSTVVSAGMVLQDTRCLDLVQAGRAVEGRFSRTGEGGIDETWLSVRCYSFAFVFASTHWVKGVSIGC